MIRILITPVLVIAGIMAVLFIFTHTIALMPQSLNTEVMKEISGVAGTAIAMIGTLVGFIAGHTAGAAGKERADERAVTAMEQQMKVEKSIAALWGMDPEMMEKARQQLPGLYWG